MLTNLKNQSLHLIGIGGSGMSGLANILLDLQFSVSGSDINPSETTSFLIKKGAKIYFSHDASNIKPDISAVVYSNAIPENNLEMLQAKKLNIPLIPRAELLKEITTPYKSIGITGTHGKTTTTALITHLLQTAELDPSFILGGTTKNLQNNSYIGNSNIMVYEACEAFASIDYITSEIAVVTNIDNDHMDFYKNMDNLLQAFIQYMNRTPFYGIIIVNIDDPYTKQIIPYIEKRYLLCGFTHTNGIFADNISYAGFQSSFDVYYQNKKLDRVTINIPGKHNIYNALLSIAVALYLNIPIAKIKEALLTFESPSRRFQSYGKYKQAYIIDDYAHHPTEVTATINMAKQIKEHDFSIKRVIVIFQPHLYSRTKEHLKSFALALSEADILIISPIYGAREININEISSELLKEELDIIGFKNSYLAKDFTDILTYLDTIILPNDIIITMGAGNIFEVAKMLVEKS